MRGRLGAVEQCRRRAGWLQAGVLAGTYLGALAGAHPLARKIGAWPSVLAATAVTAATAELLEARRGR